MKDIQLSDISDMTEFVLNADKLARVSQLKDSIIATLNEIRDLKQALKVKKEELVRLLKTDLKEDSDLADLMKEVSNEK